MHNDEPQYVVQSLADCFNLGGRELVSIVGAGGKTSLLVHLIRELTLAEQRVAATTTTRIYRPPGRVIMLPPDGSAEPPSLEVAPGEAVFLAAGEEEVEDGQTKLVGLAPEVVNDLWLDGQVEFVLVEADGAKRRPIKAPRAHEPVIPDQTTILVGVIGLAALGRPADEETVFNLDGFCAATDCRPGEIIEPEHLARLIVDPQGLFKGAPAGAWPVVFLNQADLPGAQEGGRRVASILGQAVTGLRIVVGSVWSGARDVYDLTG